MTPQIMTVFRNRLVPDAALEYAEYASFVAEMARTMPGFVDAKTFTAADGERVTIVTFADRASHDAWRDHPDHREAQRRGVDHFYSEYTIQVGEVSYSRSFLR